MAGWEDLLAELQRAKALVDAEPDLPGYDMSAKEFGHLLSKAIGEIDIGGTTKLDDLIVLFLPTSAWDDLVVQMQAGSLAKTTADNICRIAESLQRRHA